MGNDSGRLLVNYHTHTWRCMHAQGTDALYAITLPLLPEAQLRTLTQTLSRYQGD